MVRKLFVEGGGNNNDPLAKECREGFTKLLQKTALKGSLPREGRLPRVIPCGGRAAAFRDFSAALSRATKDDRFFLLVDSEDPVVDSEDPVQSPSAWQHVAKRQRDKWSKPAGAKEEQLHLMVQCMETWFLADREALKKTFPTIDESALPKETVPIEQLDPEKLRQALNRAFLKGYSKGDHSFKILAALDPAKIRAASPWAERFFDTLEKKL